MPNSESSVKKDIVVGAVGSGSKQSGRLLYFANYNSSVNFRYYREMGDCLRGRGKFQEARIAWERAAELEPNDIDIHLDLGALLAENGELEAAISHFEKAVKLDSDNIDANYFLGLAHFRLEHFRQALKFWKHCFKCKAEDLDEVGLRMCLAEAYRALGRFKKAIFQLYEILGQSPYNLDAYNVLSMVFFEMGEEVLAMEVLQKAIAYGPDFYRSHLNLGVIYFSRGAIDMAIHEFRKACKCNPLDADSFYNLARSLSVRGDIDGACVALYRSIELDSTQLDGLSLLGNLELVRGRYNEARSHFAKILETDPDNVDILCAMAEAEHLLYNYQEAETYLQKALKLEPKNPMVHYSLALLYRDQSKMLSKSLSHMRMAVELAEETPELQLLYGDILADSGKMGKAMEAWGRAVELDPQLADDVNSRLKSRNQRE